MSEGQPPGNDPEGPKGFWRRTPFLMAAPPLAFVIIIAVVGCVTSSSTGSTAASFSASFSASASGSPSASGSGSSSGSPSPPVPSPRTAPPAPPTTAPPAPPTTAPPDRPDHRPGSGRRVHRERSHLPGLGPRRVVQRRRCEVRPGRRQSDRQQRELLALVVYG